MAVLSEQLARKLIEDAGGKVEEVSGPLPDGSGFMIGSFPLRKDHWIYSNEDGFNVPPMPLRIGEDVSVSLGFIPSGRETDTFTGAVYGVTITRKKFEQMLRAAGKYAVRCATMNGKEMDFDPDALLQNLVVGMFGYGTENALSGDEWANPPDQNPNKTYQIND